MNRRALSWFWFVPPMIVIASGVWVSTGGTGLADGLTDQARSWQEKRDVEAGLLMDAVLTTERLSVSAQDANGAIRLVTKPGKNDPDKPDTDVPVVLAAGDTVSRSIDVTISRGASYDQVYLTTESAEENELAKALRVKVTSCESDWVVGSHNTPTCNGETEVLVGDVALIGSTISVLDGDSVIPGKTHHLLLELRVPSDTGNSAAGQEADLTFRFEGM